MASSASESVAATSPPPGGSVPGVLPSEAPALLWTGLAVVIAVWWLWPWLNRVLWVPRLAPTPKPVAAPIRSETMATVESGSEVLGSDSAIGVVAVQGGALCDGSALPSASGPVVGEAIDLNFDPPVVFDAVFTKAADLLAEALALPPHGHQYAEATSALHRVTCVLDRLLLAWGSDANLLRVARLREDSDSFSKHFGGPRRGGASRAQKAARDLLELAGFERHEADGNPCGVWIFRHEDALSRLHVLTVRLCLRKHTDLQRTRGTGRWTQTSNAAVVPQRDDSSLLELFGLYRQEPLASPTEQPSLREKNLEVAIRAKLHERRQSIGLDRVICMHEGLAGAARTLAQAQRLRVRAANGDLQACRKVPIDSEVRSILAKLPLPPGFHAAHLHWHSDELPRLFGLASTTGKSSGGDAGDVDKTADILSKEAVGFWATRQKADVGWPCATVLGVGAALDYTVNRGFVVLLLAGFEGLPAEEMDRLDSDGSLLKRDERRSSAATSSSLFKQKSEVRPFGAKVRTLTGGASDTPLNPK
eukprot:TRINITY_DN26604_c0_g1_i1.p1 TRINITY_DN26604_c0_g1~~TRINITY_DN26604_c0_g1_i1.p1  ORF type:complete len:548 (-),score=87.78 TRINITY_DN26604_c0_g1_i1:202-1803(-)